MLTFLMLSGIFAGTLYILLKDHRKYYPKY